MPLTTAENGLIEAKRAMFMKCASFLKDCVKSGTVYLSLAKMSSLLTRQSGQSHLKYEKMAVSKKEAHAMEEQPTASLVKHFEGLSDPRIGNAKAHIFLEILIIAILAVICGADGWSDEQ